MIEQRAFSWVHSWMLVVKMVVMKIGCDWKNGDEERCRDGEEVERVREGDGKWNREREGQQRDGPGKVG